MDGSYCVVPGVEEQYWIAVGSEYAQEKIFFVCYECVVTVVLARGFGKKYFSAVNLLGADHSFGIDSGSCA